MFKNVLSAGLLGFGVAFFMSAIVWHVPVLVDVKDSINSFYEYWPPLFVAFFYAMGVSAQRHIDG